MDDFSQVLADALPLFLAVVVGLGFLVLVLLFRSLVIPLTAAATALLSFSAALGITVFVFQWGYLTDIFGVTGTGPILPFLPIMLFSILFGLSMDYQVFLVSRMPGGMDSDQGQPDSGSAWLGRFGTSSRCCRRNHVQRVHLLRLR